ncbi:MAG: ABC transporter permease [Burkholderiales bacterium]|nr:ABC transporter permease [Anaerolineae bacterium]
MMQQETIPAARPVSFSPRQFILDYAVYMSLALLLIVAFFVTPQMFTQETLFLVLRQASQLGIVAIGQTLVMLVAGLDLSVGGVIVVTAIVIAKVTGGDDSQIPSALGLALVIGMLIGFANSLLITKRNVPPFVATLGMLVLVNGAQQAYTRGIPSGYIPDGLTVLNTGIGVFPVSFLLWIGLTLLMAFVLYGTSYGRRVFAVGSNREAARLSGINVDRTLISVYILCSIFAVIAGIVLTSYVGYVDRYLGRGFDLDSIAAAVVGGTAFTGGRGSLLGTVAGVLIVQFLSSMTLALGLDVQVQLIVKGLVIVAAVALYSLAARTK